MARDGKAMCVYGGAVQNTRMDYAVDYTMHATTERWNEMGAGEYGPMKAMMFGRLKFTGPKVEAMGVMGPFEAFLRLPGKIPGDKACPAKSAADRGAKKAGAAPAFSRRRPVGSMNRSGLDVERPSVADFFRRRLADVRHVHQAGHALPGQ
ncbi:MAG TPA: SCP2 sterol-binding domain-containing protein [Thiobacillaceae bacterium]